VHTSIHSGRTGNHPASPHAMVLTVSFVLSPAIGLSCHRHPADMARPPGRARAPPLDLTPASRRQDHTTSPSASAPFVCAPRESLTETALRSLLRAGTAASTASRPAFVTIAIRPSVGQDGCGYRFDLGFGKTEIFLQIGLDRQFTDLLTDLPVGQISRGDRAEPAISACPWHRRSSLKPSPRIERLLHPGVLRSPPDQFGR
jgi:hypothetical protein